MLFRSRDGYRLELESSRLRSIKYFIIKTSYLFFWIAGFFSFKTSSAQVYINEIMPANFDQVWDENTYTLPGWIELYNASSKSIDLTHYYLTDDPDRIKKWQIPYGTKIGGYGHLLIWCDATPGRTGTSDQSIRG